jgi:hypothetical protein
MEDRKFYKSLAIIAVASLVITAVVLAVSLYLIFPLIPIFD